MASSSSIPSTDSLLTITTSSSTLPVSRPLQLSDQGSKVGFVGYENTNNYGLDGSHFTLGFHRSTSGMDALVRAFLGGILPNAPEAKLTSSVTIEEATQLATSIIDRFHVPVTIVKTLGSSKSSDYVVTAIQIHDMRQIRSILHFVYEQGFLPQPDGTIWPVGYIAPQDIDVLDLLCNEIETTISHHDSLVSEITPAQVELLREFSEAAINGIIDTCATIENGTQLREWSPEMQEPIDQKMLALSLLIQCCQSDLDQTFGEKVHVIGFTEDYQPTETQKQGEVLQDIYNGNSKLEAAFGKVGVGVPTLQQQRLALIQFIVEKVSERFGTGTLIDEKTAATVASLGINPQILIPMAARLFAEGYELDALPYCFSEEEGSTMQTNPFTGVIDGLKGEFGEESFYGFNAKHKWNTPEGKTLEGDAARMRFAEIHAEIESSIASSTSRA